MERISWLCHLLRERIILGGVSIDDIPGTYRRSRDDPEELPAPELRPLCSASGEKSVHPVTHSERKPLVFHGKGPFRDCNEPPIQNPKSPAGFSRSSV